MTKYLLLVCLIFSCQLNAENRQLPLHVRRGMLVTIKEACWENCMDRKIFVDQDALDHFYKNYGYPAPIELKRASNITLKDLSNFELILKNCDGVKIIDCSSYTITDLGGNKNIQEINE